MASSPTRSFLWYGSLHNLHKLKQNCAVYRYALPSFHIKSFLILFHLSANALLALGQTIRRLRRLFQPLLSTAASGKSIIKLASVPFRIERKSDGGMRDGRERERGGRMYWGRPGLNTGQPIRYGSGPIEFHVMRYCT